ncbi:DUF4082 domain-containing protein [Rhizomonospora bruguierae]|uniref:DUF4082 domain-containing protein n=1 Tax=Rhizomonospora bruguierae TaxID=1581705 RepID=UPI001BD0F268|nr:DUF4082 domain-containing protein [Micromonospora sp. NBRC 107566]
MATIFGGAPGPSATFDDGTTIELGMVWRSAVDTSWVGVWVWGPDIPPTSVTVSGWQVTSDISGTLLASKAAAAPLTSGAWNLVQFDEPVPVVVGEHYCAQYRSNGPYAAEPGRFTAAAVTNGDLTAIRHATEPPGDPLANGRYLEGVGFAAGNGGGAWYGIDVEVGGGAPEPAQGSAALGLDLEVAAVGGRRSAGTAGAALALAVAAVGRAPVVAPASGAADLGVVLSVRATGWAPGDGQDGRGETVTIVRSAPSGVDPYGDPLPSTVERIPIGRCIVADGATSSAAGLEPATYGRDPIVTDYLVLPPADAPAVLHTDQVEIRGLLCDVVGRPFFWRNALTGTAFGSQFRANAAEG